MFFKGFRSSNHGSWQTASNANGDLFGYSGRRKKELRETFNASVGYEVRRSAERTLRMFLKNIHSGWHFSAEMCQNHGIWAKNSTSNVENSWTKAPVNDKVTPQIPKNWSKAHDDQPG